MLVSVQQDCSCAGAGSLFCRLPAAVPQHFFKAHRGELKTHRHGAWGLPPTSPTGYKFMQSELAASQQFPQKQTGNSRFAVPQRILSNPTNWVERTRSTAATLPRSSRICTANPQCCNAPQKLTNLHSKSAVLQRSPETRICIANPQCRSASSQIPRICGSKFAVPQRSSPNPRICGSKFAAPQRFSVEASRLPNTARRRG